MRVGLYFFSSWNSSFLPARCANHVANSRHYFKLKLVSAKVQAQWKPLRAETIKTSTFPLSFVCCFFYFIWWNHEVRVTFTQWKFRFFCGFLLTFNGELCFFFFNFFLFFFSFCRWNYAAPVVLCVRSCVSWSQWRRRSCTWTGCRHCASASTTPAADPAPASPAHHSASKLQAPASIQSSTLRTIKVRLETCKLQQNVFFPSTMSGIKNK